MRRLIGGEFGQYIIYGIVNNTMRLRRRQFAGGTLAETEIGAINRITWRRSRQREIHSCQRFLYMEFPWMTLGIHASPIIKTECGIAGLLYFENRCTLSYGMDEATWEKIAFAGFRIKTHKQILNRTIRNGADHIVFRHTWPETSEYGTIL